jgi:hypothetical protein
MQVNTLKAGNDVLGWVVRGDNGAVVVDASGDELKFEGVAGAELSGPRGTPDFRNFKIEGFENSSQAMPGVISPNNPNGTSPAGGGGLFGTIDGKPVTFRFILPTNRPDMSSIDPGMKDAAKFYWAPSKPTDHVGGNTDMQKGPWQEMSLGDAAQLHQALNSWLGSLSKYEPDPATPGQVRYVAGDPEKKFPMITEGFLAFLQFRVDNPKLP